MTLETTTYLVQKIVEFYFLMAGTVGLIYFTVILFRRISKV